MKPADDAAACVAPPGGLIIGGEDGAAGTTGGAKDGCLGFGQQVEITEGGKLNWIVLVQAFTQPCRVAGIGEVEDGGRHGGWAWLTTYHCFYPASGRCGNPRAACQKREISIRRSLRLTR